MDYHVMSEDSSTGTTSISELGSSPDTSGYQSTGITSPLSSMTTISDQPATIAITDITHTKASDPVVTAVRTSAVLKSQVSSSLSSGGSNTSEGNPDVINVMTSKQAMKRRTNSNEDETDGLTQVAVPLPETLKDFEDPAGDRYVKHSSKLAQARSNVKRVIDHLFFRALTIILILVDLGVVITAVVKSETAEDKLAPLLVEELNRLDIVALVFSCYFMMEVGLRIFAQTPRVFFRQILEIVDAVVVLTSFLVVIIDLAIDETTVGVIKVITGLRLLRLVRFGMLLRVIITQRLHLVRASRLLVSENKRRYQKEGYDLDLCYVTDRMIAMSYPSQGFMSLYRNPIEEVSRFFNDKYPGQYRLYNCCSERSYDAEKFFNNAVVRVMIDDHNVPTLRQMIDFVNDVERWMNADRANVIAIHCKGGKGRTGTMVCIWLIHTGTFDKSDDALEYFGSRRTDLSVDSKFQGVETPSQSRYVNYYEKMLKEHGGGLPDDKVLKPSKISVSGLRGIGTGDGRDLIVKFMVEGNVIFEATFGTDTNCTTIFDRETATITASLINSPNLSGDIKVMFDATSDIPRDYDDCPWFFWFNTSFIENNELSLGRESLDNPHQKRAWKIYKEDFRVTLNFDSKP